MDQIRLRELLQSLQAGKVDVEQTLTELRHLPFEDLHFAKPDHHRGLRQGFPEVIYGPGKTTEQLLAIIAALRNKGQSVVVTRIEADRVATVTAGFPDASYYPEGRILLIGTAKPRVDEERYILVMTAGTGDMPVAEEAAVTAEIMGQRVERLYDVGVAGIHRLLSYHRLIQGANVLVVAAGMEGALPSVVGGMVAKPVIAVPTSVGYGASLQGLAPLLTMLNSCAAGIGVMNIDNGFGAGRLAVIINQMR